MKAYSYVVEHDLGFAPNPYHGACTLGCCKPQIRKLASVGDIILGTGAKKIGLVDHLIYWMKIDEIQKFDEFWEDARFRMKRPKIHGTRYLQLGDNIYHRDQQTGVFLQEESFHSLPHGVLSAANLKRDTATTEKVLIGRTYGYWGRAAPPIPDHLKDVVKRGPSHKCRFMPEKLAALIAWLETLPPGLHDDPADWQLLDAKAQQPKTSRKRKYS